VATVINPLVKFTNLSTNINSALWDFNDGDSSSIIHPSHSFPTLNPYDYNVKMIAVSIYGCRDTAESLVPVKAVPTFYAPTAFSPDKDRLNDDFFVTGTGVDPKNFSLKVFDRWGEVIWLTNTFNPDDGTSEHWNGIAKTNKISQNGVYKWLCVYKDVDGNEHEYSGNVNLIR
jgi:gliding motility-associated-like protein